MDKPPVHDRVGRPFALCSAPRNGPDGRTSAERKDTE
jgi:hypothetical protein